MFTAREIPTQGTVPRALCHHCLSSANQRTVFRVCEDCKLCVWALARVCGKVCALWSCSRFFSCFELFSLEAVLVLKCSASVKMWSVWYDSVIEPSRAFAGSLFESVLVLITSVLGMKNSWSHVYWGLWYQVSFLFIEISWCYKINIYHRLFARTS